MPMIGLKMSKYLLFKVYEQAKKFNRNIAVSNLKRIVQFLRKNMSFFPCAELIGHSGYYVNAMQLNYDGDIPLAAKFCQN